MEYPASQGLGLSEFDEDLYAKLALVLNSQLRYLEKRFSSETE